MKKLALLCTAALNAALSFAASAMPAPGSYNIDLSKYSFIE